MKQPVHRTPRSEIVRLSLLVRGRGNHLRSGYPDRQQLVGEARCLKCSASDVSAVELGSESWTGHSRTAPGLSFLCRRGRQCSSYGPPKTPATCTFYHIFRGFVQTFLEAVVYAMCEAKASRKVKAPEVEGIAQNLRASVDRSPETGNLGPKRAVSGESGQVCVSFRAASGKSCCNENV